MSDTDRKDTAADPSSLQDLPPTDVTIESARGGMTVSPTPQFNPKELKATQLKTEWITS